MSKNIVVIGGSAAGMSFAAKYKRNCKDDNVLLFESRDYISFGACGLPYYIQDQFSDKNEMISRTPSEAIDSGIDVRIKTPVTKINSDKKFIVADGQEFKYDKLIIATGANPIVPPFATIDNEQVLTVTSMEDGEIIRNKFENNVKHVTIIGAGFIGLEMMDAAVHLGIDVTVVERSNSILNSQFSKEMVSHVEADITSNNVDLQLNTSVLNINNENGLEVVTDKSTIKTDLVVVAIGFSPNSSLLKCNKLANGAYLVDKNGMTSINDIYAVGDCASTFNPITNKDMYLPLATNANKYAKSLADHLAGIETSFNGMIASSCLKVLNYDMARTGLSEKELELNKTKFKTTLIKDKTHTNYYQGNEDIYIKMMYCPTSYKIYGAEIVGKKDVVHRINTLALAITYEITTKQLAYADFAYAPPFARTWESLNTAANACK